MIDSSGTMTNSQKHAHCLSEAEAAEAAANKREQQIISTESRDLNMKMRAQPGFYRDRKFDVELSIKVKGALAKDPMWNAHVSRNKWFIAQATMYGIATLIDMQANDI